MKTKKYGRLLIVSILMTIVALGSFFVMTGCAKKDGYTITFIAGAENVYYYDELGQRKPVPESGIIQENVKSFEQINIPTFSRPGYNFMGWNDSLYDIDKDRTFEPLWEKYTFTVTYNGNGGTFKDGEKQVVKENITDGYAALEQAPIFVREGYSLSWDRTEEEFAQITSSCTVNAVWTPIKYNLTFKDQNGNDFANNTMQVAYNSQIDRIDVVAPTVEGKRFSHWEGEDGLPIDKGVIWTLLTDLTLRPCYVDADEFIITYDLNGGQRQNKIYSFNKDSQVLPISNPFKNGCEFLGWLINDSETPVKTEDITLDDVKVNGQLADVSLKAVWGGNTYYISFDADGGTISNSNPFAAVYGEVISGLPTVEKKGYVFDGWLYNGQEVKDGDISYFTESVTLTAKYLYTYKLKFSLTTRVYGKDVERKLVNWGDLPYEDGQNIEDIVIEIMEGQSLKDVIEDFNELPVVNTDDPNDNTINGYKYLGYWRWYQSKASTVAVKIYPDTIFNPQTFTGVLGGGTITIIPACQGYYSPFV
ncbi:MAG: hypothetical protein E7348_05120 [Clostridiales bacterium]|nr:hypothetical protein [Clostridiales bacterium]